MSNRRYEYSFLTIAISLLSSQRRNYFRFGVTATFLVVFNFVILQSIFLGERHQKNSGPLNEAVALNQQLALMADFNRVSLVGAITIAIFLVFSMLNSISNARHRSHAVLHRVGANRFNFLTLHLVGLLPALAFVFILAMLLAAPASWLYQILEGKVGLAPYYVGMTPFWEPFVISYGVIATASILVTCLIALANAKVNKTANRVNGKRLRQALGALIVFLLGVALLLPQDIVPGDIRMLVVIPWSLTVVLLFGPFVTSAVLTFLARAFGKWPKALTVCIALSRVKRSFRQRVNPVLPLTIVVGFVISMSMVMATGQAVAREENYSDLRVQSIANLDNRHTESSSIPDFANFREELGPKSLVVLSFYNFYLKDSPYSPEQPSVAAVEIGKIKDFFHKVETPAVEEPLGKNEALATSNSDLVAGDSVVLTTVSGATCELQVVGTAKVPSFLSYEFLVDSSFGCAENSPSEVIVYSHLDQSDLNKNLPVGQWSVKSTDEWLAELNSKVVGSQRQALVMIFLVPALLAAVVTTIAMSTRRRQNRESDLSLFCVGMPSVMHRYISLIEGIIAQLVSLFLLLVPVLSTYVVISQHVRDSAVSITFDILADSVILLFSLLFLFFSYWRSSGLGVKQGKASHG